MLNIGIYRLVEVYLLRLVDQSLFSSAIAIRDVKFTDPRNNETLLEDMLARFLGDRSIRLYALLFDVQAKETKIQTKNIRIKFDVTPNSIKRAQLGLETFETFLSSDNHVIRQVTIPVLISGQFTGEVVQVGTPLESTNSTLKSVGIVLGIVTPLALMLSFFVGYAMAGSALRPIRALSKAAERIHIGDLKQRIHLPLAKDELHRLTATFNEMIARLEESVDRQKRFTGDVSHELRTSLAVLQGEAEFALRKERTIEDYVQALNTIKLETIHMSQIVEDLLLLSKAQSKSVAINWDEINLGQFLNDLQKSVGLIFEQRSIHLEIEQYVFYPFFASGTYLLIILKNLLINAAKHSHENQTVFLKIYQEPDKISFCVKDLGEGIALEDIPNIFAPFYRADTARNRSAGGVGIGLSLAEALTKLHGGSITVRSSIGKGAEFVVEIPQKS